MNNCYQMIPSEQVYTTVANYLINGKQPSMQLYVVAKDLNEQQHNHSD